MIIRCGFENNMHYLVSFLAPGIVVARVLDFPRREPDWGPEVDLAASNGSPRSTTRNCSEQGRAPARNFLLTKIPTPSDMERLLPNDLAESRRLDTGLKHQPTPTNNYLVLFTLRRTFWLSNWLRFCNCESIIFSMTVCLLRGNSPILFPPE